MDDNEVTRLTLSREDLYELVWSKAISELARDFGISDVALAKRCRGLGVPVPGRGYWARVDAGQKPHRPKLPKREPQWHDQKYLTVPLPIPEEATELQKDAGEESQDDAWLTERLAFERRSENAIVVEQPPSRWDPEVLIHRDKLRAEVREVLSSRLAQERYDKLPESRKQRTWDSDGWKWRSMVHSGQRLLDYHKPRAFRVTMDTLERALAITNEIAIAGNARGFALLDDEKEGRITVVGHAGKAQFRVTEQLETRVRSSEWRKGETEKYKVPTGRLRITITDGWREGPIFEDRGNIKLETLLNRFFAALCKLVVKQWKAARKAKVRQEQERLAELRRAEVERIRAEKERRVEAERRRRDVLCAEAKKWQEAERIRSYVKRVQELANERNHVTTGTAGLEERADVTEAWVDWALNVAEELDPTSPRRETKKRATADQMGRNDSEIQMDDN